jgi:EAL domain-containing protein (putative c-di-GMP-specific phosphodiesterase class I)
VIEQPTSKLLLVEQAGDGGRTATIDKPCFTVGRASGMDLQIDNRIVSSRHAVIRFEGGQWMLEDLGSTNGTFVNGERLTAPKAIAEDDLVHFARVAFRVTRAGADTGGSDTLFVRNLSDIEGSMELVEVVDRNQAYSVFQPIFDLRSGQAIAWEALGRGVARGASLPPERMFEMASRSRRTDLLSRRLCDAALDCLRCRHCWPPPGQLEIWINLHPTQIVEGPLDEDLRVIAATAAQIGFRAVIEAPETWVNRSDEMQRLVRRVRDLGMRVAYDDFGAGQSRIQDLISVPPDYIKFDRLLIENLQTDQVKQELLRAMVHACQQLGVRTLAEGVETQSELQACRDLGIEMVQGYLLARPMRAHELFRIPVQSLPAHCQHRRLGIVE